MFAASGTSGDARSAIIDGVGVRRSDGLVLAPLFVVASLAAHAAAYVAAEPDAGARAALLAESGHAYLNLTPAAAGLAAFLVVVALALRAVGAARGVASRAASPLLVLVPAAAFLVQETLERAAAGGVHSSFVTEPAFLVGVALQLLFGLVALALSRLLVRGAEHLGRLAACRGRSPAQALPGERRPTTVALVRPKPLPLRFAGRAPPLLPS